MLIEELYKARDVRAMLMVEIHLKDYHLIKALYEKKIELEAEFYKQDIIFEKFYLPEKYYKKNDLFLDRLLRVFGGFKFQKYLMKINRYQNTLKIAEEEQVTIEVHKTAAI